MDGKQRKTAEDQIGGVGHYANFLGDPEDEKLAGTIYNNLPRYPSHNLVNRALAVKVIAEGIRELLGEA